MLYYTLRSTHAHGGAHIEIDISVSVVLESNLIESFLTYDIRTANRRLTSEHTQGQEGGKKGKVRGCSRFRSED